MKTQFFICELTKTIDSPRSICSQFYNTIHDTTWETCDPAQNPFAPVCENPPTGGNILEAVSSVYALVKNEDNVVQDIGTVIAIAVFWKLTYVAGVIYKSSRVSKIHAA